MARSPQYHIDPDRTYGIEIEAFWVDSQRVAVALTAAGVPCEVQGYNHMTSTTWKLVGDGSIQGPQSFELVSPILRGIEGLQQITTVCRVLGALGARVNKSCGLHVHHGANDLALAHWKTFVKYYMKYETTLDTLMPESRRANQAFYCRSLLTDFVGLPEAFTAIDRATTLQELASLVNKHSRYYKLNLQAFWRHGTVEVRHHSGTVEAEKICHWVSLTQGLLMLATQKATVQPPERTGHTPTLAHLCRLAAVPAATQKFYTLRQTALAA